ncbi:MAG: signal peptidase II [Alphaproteobacteria bacterium]|nr:signal peptidase II [Alphaproteobacteria bacterium]
MIKILKTLAAIFGIVAIDQIVKWKVLFLLLHPESPEFVWDGISPVQISHVTNFFNILFTWNPGTAFSFLRDFGVGAPLIMIIATGIIIALVAYYLFARANSYERAPLILILGGALGNFIDRLRFGAVVDFLDFHVGAWHWPVFNVADVFITVGVLLYILNWWVARRRCLKNIKG